MKKILLATTAAICAGGVASAEVTLSGEGKLGLSYTKAGTTGAKAETTTISSANVKFTLSGTSDNDILGGFGASFTLDADEGVDGGKLQNPFTVYVGSPDGPIGKIEGGTDLAQGDEKASGLGDPGLNGIGVDNVAEAYWGTSPRSLRYEKALGGASIALTADLDDAWAIGADYAVSDQITLGAGYDRASVDRDADNPAAGANDLNTLSFGVKGGFGAISGGFLYSQRSTTVPAGSTAIADKSAYGIEVGYALGDTTFTGHYSKNDETADGTSAWGVGMSHNLGGGLSLKGAFGNVDDTTVANFGLLMAF